MAAAGAGGSESQTAQMQVFKAVVAVTDMRLLALLSQLKPRQTNMETSQVASGHMAMLQRTSALEASDL